MVYQDAEKRLEGSEIMFGTFKNQFIGLYCFSCKFFRQENGYLFFANLSTLSGG